LIDSYQLSLPFDRLTGILYGTTTVYVYDDVYSLSSNQTSMEHIHLVLMSFFLLCILSLIL